MDAAAQVFAEARTALLAWDAPALARAASALRDEGDTDVVASWRDLLEGRPPADPMESREASVLRLATQALLLASRSRYADALAFARRACGRVREGCSADDERFAYLVLARMRRLSGRPHLALHVASALAGVCPPEFSPQLAWELLLAGGEERALALSQAAGDRAQAPAWALVRATAGALAAARAGDRKGFPTAVTVVREALPAWADVRREAIALVAALDPTTPSPPDDAPEGLREWITGARAEIPLGVHALTELGAAAPDDGITAIVVAGRSEAGRRCLRAGLALAEPGRTIDRDAAEGEGDGGPRTDTGLAVLALAGPNGLPRDEFFRALYGFRFVADRHQGVLDVLVHRMRARLGATGAIRREAGDARMALDLAEPLRVRDGRCAIAAPDRVLRALATLGTGGAQDAAALLHMPLRTVQAALKELLEDGACRLERVGRHVVYRVQDTTFTTTGTRLAPPLR